MSVFGGHWRVQGKSFLGVLHYSNYRKKNEKFKLIKVTYLKPDVTGRITVEQIEEALTPETVLVSIMAVNNEVGVKQDIGAFGALCKSKKGFLRNFSKEF